MLFYLLLFFSPMVNSLIHSCTMYIPAVKSHAECWNTEKPSLNILNLISNPLKYFFNDFLNEASWSVGGTSSPFNFRKTPATLNILLKTTNRVYFNFTPTHSQCQFCETMTNMKLNRVTLLCSCLISVMSNHSMTEMKRLNQHTAEKRTAWRCVSLILISRSEKYC